MEVNKLNKNNFQRNFIFRFFVFLAVVLVTIGGGFAVTSGDVQIEGGDNYSTIQAAINAAQDGDTILVGPGVYDESFIVNKELNLIGTNNPVINGKIELNSNNIIIDGLKINGTDRGVEFYHNLDHITVRNSFISDTTTGIYINPTTANNITIFNNNITNTVAAIGGDSYEGISIIQNNLYNNQEGVGYSDSLSRNGPLLEDNNFSNNQIQVKDYSLSTIDMNAVFSNNIFDKAILTSDSILSSIQAAINAAQDGDTIFVGAGVYEENLNIPNNLNNLKLLGSNYGISSNSTRNQETIIKGYLRTGSGQSNWPNNFTFDGFSLLSNGDRAIIFRIQGDVNIKNNIIDQNESGQNQLYAIGFVAHSAGTNLLNLNFENNTLRNSRNGLYVDYTPTKGNIENNIFENIGSNPSFNEGSAIFSRSHINSINGNIFNNTGRGINFHPNHNTSTTVIDNLFEETNIYVRDNSGLIDLSSTFSNNQFAEQSIILDGNSIVPTTLVSIYNIDTNAGYSSIQNAINAANEGETILVEEGIYEETIDINVNNLTLISSSGAELTTIIGGSASSSASSATVRITTNNIILDGFTIDNLNNQAGSISGGNNAANVTIQNNIITNSQRGVRSDYYGKFGDSLMIYNNTFFELTRAITNTEDIPSLYVINNSFINININAVSFGSGIEDISIEGNSFENVGGRSITVWQDVVLSSGITLESILSSNLFDTSAGFSNGFNSEFIVVTSTISQAIVEAGDGDTILVGEGIYEESLTILKNLSL
ncbi:MAG: NosD domain-containing protein, partial [Candidatus Woesearchaeota archaeon]